MIQHFKTEMKEYAAEMEFEKAEIITKKNRTPGKIPGKIGDRKPTCQYNAMYFLLLRDGDDAYVNYLMVQNGTIVQTHTIAAAKHILKKPMKRS